MRYLVISTVLLLVIAPVSVSEIKISIQFETYGEDKIWDIIEFQNGYLLAGITTGSYLGEDRNHGKSDIFIQYYSSDHKLQWSGLFGGSSDETFGSVITSGFIIYVVGTTSSAVLYESPTQSDDAFLLAILSIGTLLWSSVYGGSKRDYGTDIIFHNNHLFLSFTTFSDDLPQITNSFLGGTDTAIIKVDTHGTVVSSLYVGGSDMDAASSLVVVDNHIYILGTTASSDLPQELSEFQDGDFDMFLSSLSKSSSYFYSLYWRLEC